MRTTPRHDWRRSGRPTLSFSRNAPRAVSDSKGRYNIVKLSPGTYRLVTLARGYIPSYRTFVDQRGKTSRVDIELTSGGTIRGRVVTPAGNPIAGATLQWRRSADIPTSGGHRLAETVLRWEMGLIAVDKEPIVSGADGRFEVPYLEAVQYDVEARTPGRLPATAWEVPVAATDVALVLEPGGVIRGRVVNENGEAVSGARLVARASRQREVHRLFDSRVDVPPFAEIEETEAISDLEGVFRLEGLPSGPWDVRVDHDRFAPREVSATIEGADLGAASTVDLKDITLSTPKTIVGRVVGHDGETLAAARVWAAAPQRGVEPGNILDRDRPEALVETLTGADGTFQLEGLSTGRFTLLAEHPTTTVGRVDDVVAGTADVTVRLSAGVTLKGLVIADPDGAPVAGADVSVRLGARKETRTDERGRFLVHGLSLHESFRGTVELKVRAEGYDRESERVSLQVHDPNEDIEIRLGRLNQIEGRVIDELGEGVPGATVVFTLGNEDEQDKPWQDPLPRTFTAADGSFELTPPRHLRSMIGDIRPSVRAYREGFKTTKVEFDKLPASGDAWPHLELALSRGAQLQGVVRDTDGHAVAGARLVALPAETSTPFSHFERAVPPPSAVSNADGAFNLRGIEEGPLTIVARAAGFAPVAKAAVAGESGVTIVVQVGGTIRGRVVDHEGIPLVEVEIVARPEATAAGETGDQRGHQFNKQMDLRVTRGASRARTDASGNFTLTHLPEAPSFAIIARQRGYAVDMVTDVNAGDRLDDFVLRRFSAVAGRVLNARTREPVREFKITAVDVNARTEAQKHSRMQDPRLGSRGELRVLDPLGRFYYDGLHAGPHEFIVSSPSHTFVTREVTLEVGEERDLEILLSSGGSVAVSVVDDETGAAFPGALVTAFFQSDRRVFDGSRSDIAVGEDGVAHLVGLRPGAYHATASHPYGIVARNQDLMVEIAEGELKAKTLRLTKAGRIVGRVLGLTNTRDGQVKTTHSLELRDLEEASKSPANAARPNTRRRELSVHVRASGEFEKDAVPPGTYRLILSSQDHKDGEFVEVAPNAGFSELIAVGPEREFDLGEIEVRGMETTRVELQVPDHE